MKLRSLLSLLIFAASACAVRAQSAAPLVNESLHYDVIYKWGFINKVAGYATMTLNADGPDYYRATVTARNAPWANAIYTLRDTLYTVMNRANYFPLSYTYIAHEAGKYKKDVLKFSRQGNEVAVRAVRYRRPSPSAPLTSSTVEFEGSGTAVDMLSSFYYLRTLNFPSMRPGQTVTANIFSGSNVEKLTIIYKGEQQLAVGGVNYSTYCVTFTFTRRGVQSSAPITGWITADARRIPVQIEGQLPVGKVRAVFTGENP